MPPTSQCRCATAHSPTASIVPLSVSIMPLVRSGQASSRLVVANKNHGPYTRGNATDNGVFILCNI